MTTADSPTIVSWGRKLSQRAETVPDEVAVVIVRADGSETEVRWGWLDAAARRFASLLAARGVDESSRVVVGLPRCPEHLIATFAAWKLGACVVPLRDDLPVAERAGLVELADAAAVVADWDEVPGAVPRVAVSADEWPMVSADLDIVPTPAQAISSGGSTGRPKLIVSSSLPGGVADGQLANPFALMLGLTPGQTLLQTSPLYHGLGFNLLFITLFDGMRPVIIERFIPEQILDIVERHKVNLLFLVPTMMQRLLRVPGVEKRDFSSITTLCHTSAICPPWVKRGWIDILGPERVLDVFGMAEQIGATMVRGDVWLERPGTVGQGLMTEIKILDESGFPVPTGEVGEIFMRMAGRKEVSYKYEGSPLGRTTSDGFASVGDLGWLDADGYLYIADRRTDLIISGGANVYPAEVEAVLGEHPDVADVVVVGRPDEEWGKAVHAVVELVPGATTGEDQLEAWCRERLASYKRPKTYAFVEEMPRAESGKINRSALI